MVDHDPPLRHGAVLDERARHRGGRRFLLVTDENLGAAKVELSPDDLRDIDGAAARITIHGDRYPAHMQALVGR